MAPALAWMDWGFLQGVVGWWLAFAVGFVVGGFVVGLAVQGLVAILSNQKVPLMALWLIRILGGIVCGWLLALALAGRGQPGPGGPGGMWGSPAATPDNGPSKDHGVPQDKPVSPVPPIDPKKTPDNPPQPVVKGERLDIEVLSVPLVEALQKPAGPVDQDRCYRVSGRQDKGVLLNLSMVLQRIQTQTDPPVRQVYVILYQDSPLQGSPRPKALLEQLRALRGPDGKTLEVIEQYRETDTPR